MDRRRRVGILMTALATAGALMAVTGLAGGAQGTGTITGVVTMNDPPPPSTLAATADQTVCGDTAPNETIVADSDGHVANAVVRVTGLAWPDDGPPPTINNVDCRFVDFNIAMPFAGMNVTRPLRRPGAVRIECDSHTWMRGWVVVSNDRGVVSMPDGMFTIENVPAGTHEVTIWHETLGAQPRSVTVAAGETTMVEFTIQ